LEVLCARRDKLLGAQAFLFPHFALLLDTEVSAMSDTELLIKEIQTLPLDYVQEVLKFIDLLKRDNSPASPSPCSVFSPAYSTGEALRISAEKAAARRANPALNTFRKYQGCLKGSPNLDRDGMEIQRELRNEWD
jgi:hypothetical protein